jgi:predicted enzyme related to lactoylglutathione lyase
MAELLPPGFFCWVDVAVTDPTGSHKFFSDLFGWSRRVRPTDDAQAYNIMTLDGQRVAGICGVEQDGPSQWMSYLLVESLESSTARAEQLGAKIWKPRVEIANLGEMSVLEDPTGAVFALWQSKHGEKPSAREHGMFSWTELVTPNLDEATSFYSDLAGWSSRDARYGEMDYRVFMMHGQDVCGMKTGTGPSTWVVHFAVKDCDATYKEAETLGGKGMEAPFDLDGIGRCAVVADPSSGTFGIVEYESEKPPL